MLHVGTFWLLNTEFNVKKVFKIPTQKCLNFKKNIYFEKNIDYYDTFEKMVRACKKR